MSFFRQASKNNEQDEWSRQIHIFRLMYVAFVFLESSPNNILKRIERVCSKKTDFETFSGTEIFFYHNWLLQITLYIWKKQCNRFSSYDTIDF